MRYLIAESSWDAMTLARVLTESGTLLTRTDRPEDLPHLIAITEADLVVLEADDLGRCGLALRSLRRRCGARPLALLDRKPDRASIAAWLEAGADTVIDLAAPPEEAAMRLQAVARRAHGLGSPRLVAGRLAIDLTTRRASCDGVALHLGPKVYELLEYIALRAGHLVSRESLLSHVYGYENEPDPRVFDVYMCTLRSQLAACGADVMIETVRGAGFRFLAPDAEPIAA